MIVQFQLNGAECKQTGLLTFSTPTIAQLGLKEIVGRKMFSKSRFNNTFDDFRNERQIGNRTIV